MKFLDLFYYFHKVLVYKNKCIEHNISGTQLSIIKRYQCYAMVHRAHIVRILWVSISHTLNTNINTGLG